MEKSFKAVFSPQLFDPFPGVQDGPSFEESWRSNRPWVLSNLAHAAYLDRDKIEDLMAGLGVATTLCYDRSGAQAFLAVWPDKAVLSFRGSQPRERDRSQERDRQSERDGLGEPRGVIEGFREFLGLDLDAKIATFLGNDVLADLKFRKTQFDDVPDVKVHRGFLQELDKLWVDDVLPDLERHAAGTSTWVTGHSLGAAMATLAGMRHAFAEVVTFGEPRVGTNIDLAFKSGAHLRYRNGADPVTMVPPELPFGFDHHGELIRITDPGGATDFRYDHSIVYYSENLSGRSRL
ncbi:lipase family protein [Pelagibius sp. Alg239-R121]|uniref:lipase family protein n=1 Tax=Pelagibius sp. Alg239-R121 TaxID=2993448 RepID=UPI0024A64964|nr:lipase family protein [Pelagibius sp. Alg239-R121]